MSGDHFDGEGFLRDPIEGEEAAKHRHLFKEVSDRWPQIDNTTDVIKGGTVILNALKLFGSLAFMGAVAGAFAKLGGLL